MRRPPTFVHVITGVLIVVGTVVGGVSIGLTIRDAQAPTPASTGMCVKAVYPDGSSAWYCGSTIQVPAGTRVTAPSIPACRSDDGSGSLPCRWNARTQGAIGSDGKRHGLSFTVLPSGSPVNGVQEVIFRYDNGVTVYTTVPAA